MLVRRLAAAILALGSVAGCSDSYYRKLVIETAANEHRCQTARIANVVSENRMHGDFAYWVDVCGRERLYRMDTTTGSRFVDQTNATK